MKNILIIEDDKQLRLMLRLHLEKRGFIVNECDNGNCGINFVKNNTVDLIITDIFMPEKDGMVTISEIKKLRPEIKVIAISGGAPGGNLDFLPVAKSIGADVTINKPFSIDELINAINSLSS